MRVVLHLAASAMAAAAAPPAGESYEAEAASLTGVEAVAHDQASGGERVRLLDAAGDQLGFRFPRPVQRLRVRYSLGESSERVCTVRGRDRTIGKAIFRPTGGWEYYSSTIVPLAGDDRVAFVLTPADMAANQGATCAAIDCVEAIAATTQDERDMATLSERVSAAVMRTARAEAPAWAASLREDGTWPDIEYKGFPGMGHLTRVRAMAVAGQSGELDSAGRTRLRASAVRAFDWWLEEDPRHRNWWVNDVPVPPLVGDAVLLLQDDLSDRQLSKADVLLYRGWPPPRGGKGVGANLFYRLDGAVRLALIKRDPGMMRSVFERAGGEIRITTGEGLQEDYSFLQHGQQFYAGSYGMEFTRYGADLARLGHGTVFALPDDKVELMSHFVLDCQQWITCGHMFDPGAMGRAITRSSFSRAARGLVGTCRVFASLEWPRADEFRTCATRIDKGPDAAPTLSGNRCFWRADFMVHRRPNYYVSVKMASIRTIGTEGGNGEGLKNYHLPDGAALVMCRGDEYHDIQPVWDWKRIPGITCEQDEDAFPKIDWGRNTRGATPFAGGASDGVYGVAGFDFAKKRVKARKAWVCFDDEIVCLGAGITCTGSAPLYTVLDQCNLAARPHLATAAGGIAPMEDDERVLSLPTWVGHARIGYVVQGGDGRVRLTAVKQTGTWRSLTRGGSAEPVSRDVFTLAIDHGPRPESASYVYTLLPDVTPEDVAAYSSSPPTLVLRNDTSVQAVRHQGLERVGAVFYEAASLTVAKDSRIAVDRPCALMLAQDGGDLRLTVSNPAYELGKPVTLTVTVDGRWRTADGAGPQTTANGAVTVVPIRLVDGASREITLRRG